MTRRCVGAGGTTAAGAGRAAAPDSTPAPLSLLAVLLGAREPRRRDAGVRVAAGASDPVFVTAFASAGWLASAAGLESAVAGALAAGRGLAVPARALPVAARVPPALRGGAGGLLSAAFSAGAGVGLASASFASSTGVGSGFGPS